MGFSINTKETKKHAAQIMEASIKVGLYSKEVEDVANQLSASLSSVH